MVGKRIERDGRTGTVMDEHPAWLLVCWDDGTSSTVAW